jgi:hypothetical protein
VGCSIKQRSPAGGRWADKKIHQIEKMRHCESFIVGADEARVKLEQERSYSCKNSINASRVNPASLSKDTRVAFWNVAVVLGNYGSAFRGGMID